MAETSISNRNLLRTSFHTFCRPFPLVARFKYTSLQHLSPTALRLIARGLARQSTWLIEAELWVGDSPRASDCLTRRGRGRGGDSEPRPRVPAGRILFTICTIDAQLDGD